MILAEVNGVVCGILKNSKILLASFNPGNSWFLSQKNPQIWSCRLVSYNKNKNILYDYI